MRSVSVIFSILAVSIISLSAFGTQEAEASHFRFGHLNWEEDPNNPMTVTFGGDWAWRNSYSIQGGTGPGGWGVVGDRVGPQFLANINFGDGSTSAPGCLQVEAVNLADDWMFGKIVNCTDGGPITHTYATEGPHTAFFQSSARIDGLQNVGETSFKVETIVNLVNDNTQSPKSAIPPIVFVPANDPAATFIIPAIDADGDSLNFRKSTFGESFISNQLFYTLDANSGLVTMSTVGFPAGTMWASSITIEETQNPLIGKVTVDFITQVGTATNPPEFVSPTPASGTEFEIPVGQPFSFDLKCQDTADNDNVTIGGLSLPSGSSLTPASPTGETTALGTFNWTPESEQVAAMTFTCRDQNLGSAPLVAITIRVTDSSPQTTNVQCDVSDEAATVEVVDENVSVTSDATCDVTVGGNVREGLETEIIIDKNVPGLEIPDNTQVSLADWQTDTTNTNDASWDVSVDGFSVTQNKNGAPTFFYGDFNSFDTQFTVNINPGAISSGGFNDNDFIGFALGYQPGDMTNESANFLLIDWKQEDQTIGGDVFGAEGLAVSRVTGIPDGNEYWSHSDYNPNNEGKLTELVRGANLGNVGWVDNETYVFTFVFTPTSLQVFVDGELEIDIEGNFSDGRTAFYNYSQDPVTYSGGNLVPLFDETATVTINFLDESGSITFTETGTISATPGDDTIIFNINGTPDQGSVSGTGDYSNIATQCGNLSVNAIDNNDSTEGQVTLNQCPVPEPSEPKKTGGGDNQWDTRPTFGISHEDRATQVVENGFRFNSEEFMLTNNHHTDFAEQAVEVGTINSFSATVYADKKLKIQEFLFGIPNVGESHLAELGIEVWYDFDGNIEDVKVVQKSDVIDADTISVSHEKTKCLSTDSEPLCDTTTVSMTFLEPLADKVMAIKAIDFKNRDQRTYLNDGFDVFGDSLNPMLSKMIPSNMRDQGLLKVTQLSKYSPFWTSEDGRTFEMNSFGSFKEINQTFERFADTGDVRTRMHSGFGGILQYEQNRASNLFDASQYTAQLPESFAYIYPETGERLSEELLQEMLLQQEIAKEILEQMDKQTRHH
jgi:hypothetical protein